MTSLQQAAAAIQLKDYMSFVIITAVGYDYILTFSNEIEYIWNKPWTWMSTFFVIARYSGLCGAVTFALWGSSFLPGPVETYVVMLRLHTGNIMGIFGAWCSLIFMCTADHTVVMILRLWALYNRSRFILGILLAFYVTEAASFFIFYIVTLARLRHAPIARTAHVLGFSICVSENLPPGWITILDISQIALAALICLFIAIKTVTELLQAYKETRRLQLNRYRELLVREGTIYFAAILIFSILNTLNSTGFVPTGEWQTIMAVAIQLQIPPVTLVPRFILSLRELYVRDARGRVSDMDTAFGLTLGTWHGAVASTIVFADVRPDEEERQGSEIEMEERNSGPRRER